MDLILPGYDVAPPDEEPPQADSGVLGILLMAIIVTIVVLVIMAAVGLGYGVYLWCVA